MKRIVLMVVAAGVFACGGNGAANQAASASAEQAPAAAPSMTIALSDSLIGAGRTSDTVDLGRMRAGEVVREALQVRNDDSKPFVILSVKTSCGCTTVDFGKEPVMPGKTVPLSFEFDSKGFNGYQLKHITIYTSICATPYTLVATGEVIAKE